MANERILASVGGSPITEADVMTFIASLGQRGKAYQNEEGIKLVTEELIAQRLFLAEAKKNLWEYEEGFKAELAKVKDRLLVNYAMEKALGRISVKDEEIKAYYDEHSAELMSGESVNASHILVAEEETATALLAKIRAGEISFEEAAKENSTCPSGQNGGSLGDFTRGQMVPEFDEACFTMEVGELRGPIKTQFGYHLIRLNSKKEAASIPFEEIKEELRSRVTTEKQEKAYKSKINQLSILFPVDRF